MPRGKALNIDHMEMNESLVKINPNKNSRSVSSIVNTAKYHKAFDSIPVPKPVSEAAYRKSGAILQLTDGTDNEYLIAIDCRTGKLGDRKAAERATVTEILKRNRNEKLFTFRRWSPNE